MPQADAGSEVPDRICSLYRFIVHGMALIIISFVIYYLLCYMDYFIVLWIIPPILNESILWKYPLVSLGFVYIR
jgi:hypothetical protein